MSEKIAKTEVDIHQNKKVYYKHSFQSLEEEDASVKIERITIENVNGIDSLGLTLNKGINILTGTNGIGKTTILNCIISSFHSSNVALSAKHGAEHGHVALSFFKTEDLININTDKKRPGWSPFSYDYFVTDFGDREDKGKIPHLFDFPQIFHKLIHVDSDRSLCGDAKESVIIGESGRVGSDIYARPPRKTTAGNIKSWFAGRHFSATSNQSLPMNEARRKNYETAIRCFSSLDETVTFLGVEDGKYRILLHTERGDEIFIDYLSAGYQSSLYMLLGLLYKLEEGFPDKPMAAADCDGVILIDEIENHLHPEWQAKTLKALREMFPEAQIIITTHSPFVVQSAMPGEVIPLTLDDEKNVKIKQTVSSARYGYQGWTVEEILDEVMGMKDTRSEKYRESLQYFERAVAENDRQSAEREYKELCEMLHRDNHLSKLLEIRMAGVFSQDD